MVLFLFGLFMAIHDYFPFHHPYQGQITLIKLLFIPHLRRHYCKIQTSPLNDSLNEIQCLSAILR